mgnify:CR=1 FL=1
MGLSEQALAAEYDQHLTKVDQLYQPVTSLELTLREATQVYVEEAVFAKQANRIGDALRDHFGVPESALQYFRLHAVLDTEHSAAGLEMLAATARNEQQRRLVGDVASAALQQFPIWAVDISGD